MSHYAMPPGGLPGQDSLTSDRARFTQAYVVIPKGVQRDIVCSALPHWEKSRIWVLARPLSGFTETFSHYIVDVAPGGGSEHPESNPAAQAILFVVDGAGQINIAGTDYDLKPGSYVYLPAGVPWRLNASGEAGFCFHWWRKVYQAVDGLEPPSAFVTHEADVEADPMPYTDGAWSTQRFVAPDDLRHDMHVNIVNFEPGAHIPFAETHVMEHGIYILEGRGVYLLNQDWVEVEAGDYIWLRAFCPQACYAGGPGRFRYLLYKDVNRHVAL